MASNVTIKRRQTTGAPSSLLFGELAYGQGDDILYVGKNDTTVRAIGGAGYFAPLASPALTGTPTAPTPTGGDNSTKIATTAYVLAAMSGAGLGTVTDITVTSPSSILTVSGSGSQTISTSGTFALAFASQAQNSVFTGPTSGSGVPGFRALVAGDIPGLAASKITSGQLALAQGGTGADLSATGGSGFVLKQSSAGAVVTVAALVAGDIPNIDAGKITTGLLALARGGTGADLSATGGTGQYLKQASSGAVITVGTIPNTDLPTLDSIRAPTASVSINSQLLTNVADPVSAQDAATKAYVDAARTGLDVKASVRAATTAALASNTRSGNILTASANGTLATIDGVTLVANDRLLVKNEATGANNGLYTVSSMGSGGTPWTLTRATDADVSAEVTSGMFTFVEEGTTNVNSGWVLATADPITLNTTAISFSQFSGAGQITAGDGLSKSGNTLTVVGTTNRISVSGSGVDISSSYVGQATIVTLGTVTTGTWSATAVGPTKGGTGLTAVTSGDLLYGSASNTWSALAKGSAGQFLKMDGSAAFPTWSDTVDGGTY